MIKSFVDYLGFVVNSKLSWSLPFNKLFNVLNTRGAEINSRFKRPARSTRLQKLKNWKLNIEMCTCCVWKRVFSILSINIHFFLCFELEVKEVKEVCSVCFTKRAHKHGH